MPPLRGILLALAAVSHGTACGTDPGGDPPDAPFVPDARIPDTLPPSAILHEPFAGDAAAWPTGWTVLGGVASATVENGRARLVPTVSDYSLARMGHTLPAGARDVEVTFSFTMTDSARQGVGLYVRQNGGYLQQSATHGSGYAVFVEDFRGPAIGVWRERDGVEEELLRAAIPDITDGDVLMVRFRCDQEGTATTLSARIWRDFDVEPTTWAVTATDATPALQDFDGAVAIDAWNTATPGAPVAPQPIFVDELLIVSF